MWIKYSFILLVFLSAVGANSMISAVCQMKSCKNQSTLDCLSLNSSVSGRCCVRDKDSVSSASVTGIDLIDCSLTNISGLFHSMEHLHILYLHKNNIGEIDVDDFTGVNDLKNLTLPPNLSCPGGPSLWNSEEIHPNVTVCLEEQSTCKVFNVSCPNSNSYCSDVGPRITECLCNPGFHGYKCLRKDHFPTATFVIGICASTFVVSAFLWITQRRKVKKH
ncbi:all-trans retinoic acid-induced differentiation factor-like [Ostrea edulis]|uniref:all-trans retinoic acid-induced differentiation factor-like n=1 Tax=Ostrea edulis TaxID=37623 RepID=UPI0024AE8944|nr:all-trans retinoic acid-induced differentiation factor-like [Ostrea edulis]